MLDKRLMNNRMDGVRCVVLPDLSSMGSQCYDQHPCKAGPQDTFAKEGWARGWPAKSAQGGALEVGNWKTGLGSGVGLLVQALQHHGQIPAQVPWRKGRDQAWERSDVSRHGN